MAITKVVLSGSAGGRGVKVAATATPGTTIHATGASSSVVDEVWLYAANDGDTAVALTVEFGGTTDPDDLIQVTIPSRSGLTAVAPGLPLSGDGSSARTVRAFAGTADKVAIFGHVNRIS